MADPERAVTGLFVAFITMLLFSDAFAPVPMAMEKSPDKTEFVDGPKEMEDCPRPSTPAPEPIAIELGPALALPADDPIAIEASL